MLAHSWYLWDGRIRREAETLTETGFRVDAVCLREPRDHAQNEPIQQIVRGVHVHRLPIEKKRGGFFRYLFEYTVITILGAFKLAVLHFRRPFDVVHIHNMPNILVLAGLIPKLTGAKLILDVHDPMVEHYRATYHMGSNHLIALALRIEERLSYLLPDKIISVSETMRELLEKKGVRRGKIVILHNLPDWNIFPPKDIRDSWKKPKGQFTLLYCGTITEHYRLDIAVRALERASKRIPSLKLKVLGTGNRLTQVQELARSLGVEERIEYLDRIPIDKVREVLESADVGISTHQGGVFGDLYFSTKILEYMSQGLPVITSRTKTIARYIPEDAIFFFEPENIDNLVEQIIKIWEEPDLVRKKLSKAMELVRKYTWEAEKMKLLSLYRNMTAQAFDNSEVTA